MHSIECKSVSWALSPSTLRNNFIATENRAEDIIAFNSMLALSSLNIIKSDIRIIYPNYPSFLSTMEQSTQRTDTQRIIQVNHFPTPLNPNRLKDSTKKSRSIPSIGLSLRADP